MARRVDRGDVWMHRFAKPDKRRPVVVLTRREVLSVLDTVTIAPITRTIRGVPSEVRLGTEHGLKSQSVANLDYVQTVRRDQLRQYVSTLDEETMASICAALRVAVAC